MHINKLRQHLLSGVFVESETQQIGTTPRHRLPTNNQTKLNVVVQIGAGYQYTILAGFIRCCLSVLRKRQRRAALEMLVRSSYAAVVTLGHFSFTKCAEHHFIRSLFKEF